MPIQQLMLGGGGAVATKTYVDEIFSTYLYRGNQTAGHTITNGIDLAGQGGLVWIKSRTNAAQHELVDTVRGAGYKLKSDGTSAQESSTSSELDQFNSDGFRLAYRSAGGNALNMDYASWTFRKAPGFFDCIKFTGTGATSSSPQSISHSLESIPGMIIIKNLTQASQWFVYHKSTGVDKFLQLNKSDAAVGYNGGFSNITSSSFSVFDSNSTNTNEFIAYVFAGGESTAATARSVDFDGSGDYLSISDHSDFDIGSSEFTIEAWIKIDALNSNGAGWLTSWSSSSQRGWYFGTVSNIFNFSWSDTGSNINSIDSGYTVKADGQFHHYAVTRSGTTLYFYVDGILVKTNTNSGDTFHNSTGPVAVGHNPDGGSGWELNGKISNLRFVKGTAVYTSSFRPPTEPLTNVTNTKLLCCNSSSTTGSTVTPGTITANGNPTASTDSPFDDPAGFKFGDAGDQNVIKCGSYTTDSNEDATGNLGFEPQWVLAKRTDSTGDWRLYDSMRGLANAQDVAANSGGSIFLEANDNAAETNSSKIGLTSTGFYADQDGANRTYIYVAFRRPDGYVGKPPELGTGVFAIDQGNSSATQMFTSGFPVDFATEKFYTTGSYNWGAASRLTAKNYLYTNTTAAEAAYSSFTFDQMDGWGANSGWDSTAISYMWKRHAGFDVVAYEGDGVSTGRNIPHSMNKAPEMMWVKSRSASENWYVYHKGHNGGSGPEHWFTSLNTDGVEQDHGPAWADTVPTSTYFTVGGDTAVNKNNDDYIAMLFSSVSGVSSVGSFTGDGTNNGSHEITCGFTPRFLIIKCVTSGVNFSHWRVWDSLNGLDGSGNESYLKLNTNGAKVDGYDYIDTTSTGFKFNTNFGPVNGSGNKMIYYAHA